MATYNIDSLSKVTNIVNIATMDANNVTVSGDTATYAENVVAMLQKTLTKPIANHKYYCRCYQLKSAGSTVSDSRIEYFLEDAPAQKMTFGTFESIPDDGEWHLTSDVLSLSSPNDGEWVFRAFAVNGTGTMKRKEFLLIDLTQDFGSGHEPSKTWCDTHIPFFTQTTALPDFNFKVGDIINCPYSGGEKSISLKRGTYKLECWGARGGSVDGNTRPFSYGGYSVGNFQNNDTTVLYLNAGGNGINGTVGGYNGGGDATDYQGIDYVCSGGGATHIATSTGVLSSLSNNRDSVIIVAGGSGGSWRTTKYTDHYGVGGAGGGSSGADGTGHNGTSSSTNYNGHGGTQTRGGTKSNVGGGPTDGSFGQGGTAYRSDRDRGIPGGGGGGWYGGGGGYGSGDTSSFISTWYAGGGGGGSGYINQSLLTDASTTQETASTNPDTANYAGYIRITVLELFNPGFRIKQNAQWKNTYDPFVKADGSWHETDLLYMKRNGVWTPIET